MTNIADDTNTQKLTVNAIPTKCPPLGKEKKKTSKRMK